MNRTLINFCSPALVANCGDQKLHRPKQRAKEIRNPNIEIRNKLESKQISNWENSKQWIRMGLVLNFVYFGHLQLFRISGFVLRNFGSWCRSGHPVRLRFIQQHIWLVFAFVVFTSGCMVGPDYQRPQIDTPQTWRVEDKNVQAVINTAWWEQYNDPVLNELVQSGLQENKDIKIATARIEQFLGLYTTTRAALFPQVFAGTTAGRLRLSELIGPTQFQTVPGGTTFNNFQIFINATWEIDLWGKLRRATEAARANLLSTEEARKSVILTLLTSVANSYINLRDLDKQLEVTRQTTKSYEDIYNIFKLRYDYGYVSAMELNQAQEQYEQAAANIPFFEKAIAQQENSLSVLLGRNPGPIPRGKTVDELPLPVVPEGLPSEVLANRPDIRQAEQDLIAANANIGVAKALYFPSVSLTGLYGTASSDFSRLFSGPSRIWSVAAPITAPIFTAGAIAGQVQSAEGVQQETLFRYQQVIQTAFQEVNDSLVDQERTREQLAALTRRVEALREYVRLAWLRFDEGYSSYLEVTYSQNLLYNTELSRTVVQSTLLQAFANLYKAMGVGG
jgi:outer membrane protein, multidrug efflux system